MKSSPAQPFCRPCPVRSAITRATGRVGHLLLLALLLGAFGCEEGSTQPVYGPIEAFIDVTGGVPFADKALDGNARVNHPIGEPPTLTWSWKVDGVDAGVTSRTIDPALTAKGQVWEITATAGFAGAVVGPSSAAITIVNKAPEIVGQPAITPDPANTNDTLSVVVTATDIDNDPITLSYSWRVNNTFDVATTPTLGNTFFVQGDRVRVSVTPNDGVEDGATATSRTVRIQAAPTPVTSELTTPVSSRATAVDDSSDDGSASAAATEILLDRSFDARGLLSVSEAAACHIDPGGTLACEGLAASGITEPPDGFFSQVVVSLEYACAIRSEDQRVQCWGEPSKDLGQASPPDAAFVQIDLGLYFACGVTPAGGLGCWGDGADDRNAPPAGRFELVDVSDSYACAMDELAEVTCWELLE